MASVSDKKYCHKCGKEVPIDAKFCPYCGTALTIKQTISSPIISKKPTLAIGVFSLGVGIVFFFLGLVMQYNNNPLNPFHYGGLAGMIGGGLFMALGIAIVYGALNRKTNR
jgi:ribosomal protein L40E